LASYLTAIYGPVAAVQKELYGPVARDIRLPVPNAKKYRVTSIAQS
jgi:hypothetical protein